ncbi:MAG: HAD-IG family 5'-nucleotidase [Bdellovibrionaceae bacterium]|nr:HAD-IG family 5'-nucleotidase [Pseudobdellovibrionaceae bacterium]
MHSKVYVNRTLNLKRIRYLGLDMDHTLIRYNSEEFERLAHSVIKEKLVKSRGYPEEVLALPFDFNMTIRGLVIDRVRGNLIKLNRHSAIRATYHGLRPLDFKTQNKTYQSTYIDLSDSKYLAIDTTFSVSLAIIYSQIVEMKEENKDVKLPDFAVMADDVLQALDEAHRDGSLKDVVKTDLARFIIKDPDTVAGLEKFKQHGKKVFIVTNSDFHYTKLLLDYAINPFLKNHKSWTELFEFVVVSAQKPRFFFDDLRFLKINVQDGTMTNQESRLEPGVYQGGSARSFTRDLNLQGDEILYIGDHIYGDILRLKKDCGWRTAMVIEELEHEVRHNKETEHLTREIENLMHKKEPFEDEMTDLMTLKIEDSAKVDELKVEALQKQIAEIDGQISALIKRQQMHFNANWGQIMRAGNEESYFAYQVDRYACVYMAKLADLLALSPRTYFRAPRRPLSHEL